jgi:hypothetical protein
MRKVIENVRGAGDIGAEVQALKEEPGRDLHVIGSLASSGPR